MIKRIITTATALAMAGSSLFAADYLFPSSSIPGGGNASSTKQYVSFIFDDNGYSGANQTMYEYKEGDIAWADRAAVGGYDKNGTTKNPLNINQGDMGVAWANEKFAGSRTNPDGSPVHVTFNLITGLFVPTWGPSWQDRQSKFGGYEDPSQPYVKDVSGFKSIAVAWGREQKIGTSQGGSDVQDNLYGDYLNSVKNNGHEIGNHTIDHMETNSPLPKSEFEKWSSNGGGFDPGTDTLWDGTQLDEQAEFGCASNAYQLTHGWMMYAGQVIDKDIWKGAIKLAEDQLDLYLGVSVNRGNLFAFRAPRLEINSNALFALKELGYQYLCGLEEGYEENVDGTNFLWPYTTDNGIVNMWTQKEFGEHTFIDSTPAGLWTYPVNVMIVPENIRGQVWSRANIIAKAEGAEMEDSTEWCTKSGKITGFDFNMFILWGMTKADAVATLENSLDLRMSGNKAPMQIGCHTDYFTPIYDYATLLSDWNKTKYGLVITNGWNTWSDRKAAWEEFADYAIQKGAYIKSGHEVLEEVKKLAANDVVGKKTVVNDNLYWYFVGDEVGSVADKDGMKGDLSANIKLGAASGSEVPSASFVAGFESGSLENLDHISLSYKTNQTLLLKLDFGNDGSREVLLNNINPSRSVESGNIPLTAFHYSSYYEGTKKAIDTKDIIGIEVAPQIEGSKAEDATFTISNVTLYGPDNPVNPIVKGMTIASGAALKLASISKNDIKLNVASEGRYSVSIYSANGQLVRSISSTELVKGLNTINFGSISNGLYMIKVNGLNGSLVKKAMVM